VIIFVRHGETDANRKRLALGRADPPLTDRGEQQAAAVADRVRAFEPAVVWTSPLLRARSTAAAIGSVCGVDVEVDERLVELDYGEWDELSFADIPRDALARWHTDASMAPPGGESLEAVGARVRAFCTERVDGPTVVAVSHVSPIKAAAIWALGVDPLTAWRMFLDLASITRVDVRPDHTPYLLTYNDTTHLP
jgi:broad specificity phosphatase PhoE